MRGRMQIREVTLTPLIDVMLVVLVLFLITSPLVAEGPDVELPNVAADLIPLEDTDAVLTVTRDGRIYFRDRDVSNDIVGALLADPVVASAQRVYVRGDGEASFADVTRALAAARRAGIQGLNLVVDPREQR